MFDVDCGISVCIVKFLNRDRRQVSRMDHSEEKELAR